MEKHLQWSLRRIKVLMEAFWCPTLIAPARLTFIYWYNQEMTLDVRVRYSEKSVWEWMSTRPSRSSQFGKTWGAFLTPHPHSSTAIVDCIRQGRQLGRIRLGASNEHKRKSKTSATLVKWNQLIYKKDTEGKHRENREIIEHLSKQRIIIVTLILTLSTFIIIGFDCILGR